MRHSFATLGLADGLPLEWISKQMGHTDISLTARRYAQWLPKADQRWLDVADQAYADELGRKEDGEAEAL